MTLEVSVQSLLVDIEPRIDRLMARRKIPESAAVVPIDVSSAAVIELHAELPCSRDVALARLEGTAPEGNYCRRKSVELRLGCQAIGIVLVQSEPDESAAFIYGVVVHPGWRKTWATVLLKYSALARLARQGVLVVRFQVSARDTWNYALRGGANVCGSSVEDLRSQVARAT